MYYFDRNLTQTGRMNMSKTEISQRLKCLMADKEIRTTELARKTDLPQPTVHRIVSGISPNPHISSLKPIAKFFNVTIDQLKGLKPISWLNISGLLKTQLTVGHEIPVLNWQEVGDWKSKLQAKEFDQTVSCDAKVSENAFAVKMNDSSMEPVFTEDTILIIDPNKEFHHKDYILVKRERSNDIVFRQISIDEEHRYLKPLNAGDEKYKISLLEQGDKILGTLAQMKRSF